MAIVCIGVDLAKNVRPEPRIAGRYDARPYPVPVTPFLRLPAENDIHGEQPRARAHLMGRGAEGSTSA